MNILHIIPSYYPATKYGGPISSVHTLNKALINKSINVDVITTNAGIDHVRLNAWQKFENVNVKYIKYYGYEHFTFSPKMILELLRSINKYNIIILSSIWSFTTLIGGLISILYGKPYIIIPHGGLSKYSINTKSKLKKMIYYNCFVKYILNRTKFVRFTTEFEKETSILLFNKNNYIVVPHGVDIKDHGFTDRSSINFNYPDRYILFMGRLHAIKGLDILMKAFNRITHEYNDIYLILAGSGHGSDKYLNDYIKYNNLKDKIIFAGYVSGRVKYDLLQNALMFVMPSYYENFGMAAVEAMNYGVPIVISDQVGIHDDVKNNNAGIVVEPNSESLYKGIKSIIDNNFLRTEIAKNGRWLVEKYYNIEDVSYKIISILNKI